MSESITPGDVDTYRWVTDRDSFIQKARQLEPTTRLSVEARITVDDPWIAFRRARSGPWAACFETLGERGGWNVIGVEPTATLTVWPAELPEGTTSLDRLTEVVETEQLHRTDDTPPITGGWFGWLSYDIAREFESLPDLTEQDRDLPSLGFARFDTVASWRTPTEGDRVTLQITSCPRVGTDPAAAYESAVDSIDSMASQLRDGDPGVPWGSPSQTVDFEPGVDRAQYRQRVERVKAYIRDGDTFQVNLSQRFDGPAVVHPVDAYEALRSANPAPYGGLLETPDLDLISTSPELLVERIGKVVRTEPIAGTRPRGSTPAADRALAEELSSDPKERAEHAMLVDLERNDLGRVSVPGSVDVTEYRRVDGYASVWHLVSIVEGRLESGVTVGDLFAAMLPGGTVTGAPKPRTMEIIDELEDRRRGPYTGSMAMIGFDGSVRANMVIRTLEHHQGQFRLRVGVGVVHDSDPESE